MSALVPLSQHYVAHGGAPVITAVDPGIFTRRYFARCMACGFCADSCCAHGVDVDGRVEAALLADSEAIERHTGVPASQWFRAPAVRDVEAPGGTLRRTALRDGYCVFHTPGGRGCMLHSYALASGLDYHTVKPMVSTLFPVTVCLSFPTSLMTGRFSAVAKDPPRTKRRGRNLPTTLATR